MQSKNGKLNHIHHSHFVKVFDMVKPTGVKNQKSNPKSPQPYQPHSLFRLIVLPHTTHIIGTGLIVAARAAIVEVD